MDTYSASRIDMVMDISEDAAENQGSRQRYLLMGEPEQPLAAFVDVITQDVLVDPVVAADGYSTATSCHADGTLGPICLSPPDGVEVMPHIWASAARRAWVTAPTAASSAHPHCTKPPTASNNCTCIGGFLMSWVDEYWKV